MALSDLCFKQFLSIQDLENNNWVILNPLGNIYEIYAKRHMSKQHICKSKFHVCYHLFHIFMKILS